VKQFTDEGRSEMLSRSTCVSSCKLLAAAFAVSLATGCMVDADESSADDPSFAEDDPSIAYAEAESAQAGDEGIVEERFAAEGVPPAEVASDQCFNDAGCPQGSMCVKPAFGSNWCAQLCVWDAIGENNCPPGFECTRPFFWNRWRCTPE
jgi:hypothetical protein